MMNLEYHGDNLDVNEICQNKILNVYSSSSLKFYSKTYSLCETWTSSKHI